MGGVPRRDHRLQSERRLRLVALLPLSPSQGTSSVAAATGRSTVTRAETAAGQRSYAWTAWCLQGIAAAGDIFFFIHT